jgi:hypothetical protein
MMPLSKGFPPLRVMAEADGGKSIPSSSSDAYRENDGGISLPPSLPIAPVQRRGSPLEPAERIFPQAGVSEPIGAAAPEMPSAVRKKELCRAIAALWAEKPPAMPTESRLRSHQLNLADNGVGLFLPNVAGRVDQLDKAVPLTPYTDLRKFLDTSAPSI